jgi:hypothetical protein
MINLFLIGTCRIHRPFGCNLVKKDPPHFDTYNVLNLLGKYSFLGYFHNIKEIKQLVDLLIHNYSSDMTNEIINMVINPKFLDPIDLTRQIETTREMFQLADMIVMEISTSKNNLTTVNEEIIHFYEPGLPEDLLEIISEQEYGEIFEYLIETLTSLNKEILFVSPFNHNNLTSRQYIIEMCEKYLDKKRFFNPTETVIHNLPHSIADTSHYSNEGEVLIMNEIHLRIQTIFEPIGEKHINLN